MIAVDMNIDTDRDQRVLNQHNQRNHRVQLDQRVQTLRIDQDKEEETEEIDSKVVVIKRRPGVKMYVL